MIKYYNLVKPWSRWLFLMLFLFSLQSKALTQDSIQVSINAVNKPIEVVFKQIERQTGYAIYYGKPTLNGDEVVTIQTRASLSNVMNTLLRGRNINWALREKSIILTRKSIVGETNSNLDTIPKVNISGNIVDKSGVPIVGATVSLRGQMMGLATDNLGRFTFANIPSNVTLVISSVGYRTRQVHLGRERELKIILDSAITDIQKVEIVSNGYQLMAKERVTGSFFKVDNELFNRRVGISVLDRIRDLIPGVYSEGAANGASSLRSFTIRGVSTINADKQPLLVVDNFIYDGDPNDLNPNDVESVTVLRDAAAASIWGVRAGNGVVVVTMKKGRFTSRPSVSFTSNLTITEKPDLYSLPSVPSKDVIDLERKRFAAGYYNSTLSNRTTYPVLSQVTEILSKQRAGTISLGDAEQQISILESHDVRDDINRYLLQTSISQQYALNISGGGGSYQYYGSIGYDRSRPHDINSHNERLTIRFNNIWNPLKNLQVKAEMNWGQSSYFNSNSIGSYSSVLNSPYHQLADKWGNAMAIPFKYRLSYVDTVKFPGQLDWHYRPLDEAKNGDSRDLSYNTRINAGINYTIINGLRVDVNYQWQRIINERRDIGSLATFDTRDIINSFSNVSNGLVVYPYPVGGVYSKSNSSQTGWNFRGMLNFDRSFGIHDITLMAGMETRERETERLTLPSQYGYSPETATFGTIQTGLWTKRPSGTQQVISSFFSGVVETINRYGSYFGNFSYIYDGRYAISGSARVDQSNFFGVKANDRRVPLWSTGIAWTISREKFYNIAWLPDLRIKATFGYSGNVNAGASPFATAGYTNPRSPLFVTFATLRTSPNPQLRWEKVQNVNFGLDFGSINQRVSGNIEFFNKKGLDLISEIAIDPTSGFTSYTGNNSSVQTRGMDMSLTVKNFDGVLKWYTTAIFAYQSDKVVAYSVPPAKVGIIQGAIIIGKPLRNIYSYPWAGLNPTNGDAQFYFNKQVVGSKEYGKPKQEELVYNGQTNPPIFGALRNDFRFKRLSLSFNFSYRLGYYFRRQSFKGSMGAASGITLWQHEDYLNAWKVPGDEVRTNVPGFLNSYTDNRYSVYANSDILLERGDHIRFEDIKISYEMNKVGIKGLVLSRVSLYAYVNSIGFIWKASMYNPDTEGGITTVPRQRSLAAGASISF